MKLPRITRVTEIVFILKSGRSLTQKFTNFSYKYTAEAVTNMKWTTDDGSLFYIVIGEISAITQGKPRTSIRFRDK
jgi:hypothetical protein